METSASRLASLGALLAVLAPSALPPAAGAATSGRPHAGEPRLEAVTTGRRAERRETVPISSRSGLEPRSVLSVGLPRLVRGSRIDVNGEVTISTTCVEQISRCIGRSYRFDPHLRAWIVLASDPDATGARRTVKVSGAAKLTCEQTRPNRNHHCPLVVERGSFEVGDLRDLPCPPRDCRLNMLVDAASRKATSGEVVVVGSDQENGSVEGGKARLGAMVSDGRVESARHRTKRERTDSLPASFENGKEVVYSQRLGKARAGDVLYVRARQMSAISGMPYFVSDQVIVSTRPNATRPSALARRAVSRAGTVTETNGFNCTLGSSAFTSPCRTRKVGVATIERTPRSKTGRPKALYVNLVSRGFPKLAQGRIAERGFPPVRIADGGYLEVTRMRSR
ncbi:MAG: hypothetical protein U0R51_10275 [Solirubrobacterales bacterium]